MLYTSHPRRLTRSPRGRVAAAGRQGVLSLRGADRGHRVDATVPEVRELREEAVEFFSCGHRLAGLWRTPSEVSGPLRAVVQGPGWMGAKEGDHYLPVHRALTDAGFGVLIFDYRGMGGSEGDPTWFSPLEQLRDLRSALNYLETREDVDADRLSIYGRAATGAAHAIILGAMDTRVRAVVAQNPIADGGRWLRGMRREYEWLEFQQRLAKDRALRATSGDGELVDPFGDVVIPLPERAELNFKKEVNHLIPRGIRLEGVDELLSYRPVDFVGLRPFPLLLIGVEHDANTPLDHCRALFEQARGPKRLLVQRHTSHYAAGRDYAHVIPQCIAEWFDEHATAADVDSFS